MCFIGLHISVLTNRHQANAQTAKCTHTHHAVGYVILSSSESVRFRNPKRCLHVRSYADGIQLTLYGVVA
jgi:hypothetical protein